MWWAVRICGDVRRSAGWGGLADMDRRRPGPKCGYGFARPITAAVQHNLLYVVSAALARDAGFSRPRSAVREVSRALPRCSVLEPAVHPRGAQREPRGRARRGRPRLINPKSDAIDRRTLMTGPQASAPAWGQARWQRAVPVVLGLLGGIVSLIYGVGLVDEGSTSNNIAGWLLIVGGVLMIVGGALSTLNLHRQHRSG